jgi:hypothetical protein
MWLEWIHDERKLILDDNQKWDLIDLIWTGLGDFIAIELLQELFDFVLEELETENWISMDQVRDLFQRALEHIQFDFKNVDCFNSESCHLESVYSV